LPDFEEKISEIIIFSQYVLASIFFFGDQKKQKKQKKKKVVQILPRVSFGKKWPIVAIF
jgi:hypothetical protein